MSSTEGAPVHASSKSAMTTDSNIVSPDVLNSTRTDGDKENTMPSRQVRLQDLRRLIEMDDRFHEVTVEQIERVKMMHDRFMQGAVSDFNYNTLLLVASVLAGLGLVSNSTATIIASMLVSPLMGPVAAIAYGSTIFDRKLVRLAWTTELLSLFFCVVIGVVIGATTGATPLAKDWLTDEMLTRCTMSNFYVGIPVAFFSGLGVAVSLLDEQTNSLVGVAISASLLPPAVNCGIVWVAYAYYQADKFDVAGENANYNFKTFSHAGWVSLGLTLVNIAMIWISSMIMFRLKEVLPIQKKVFWSDLGIARKIYQGKAVLAKQAFSSVRDEAFSGNEESGP
eukprot:CCRYP_019283-RA/>CCRYP_019283-RA protein AED:0.02 eAED:0.02 QI:571/1/1/1/0.66/0.5/4/1779/337